MNSAFVDLVRSFATRLSLFPIVEVVGGAVTVGPVRIVSERDVIEEVEEVVAKK